MTNPEGYLKRRKRTRSKIRLAKVYPRLSVFRSNKFIYAQIIDDVRGITLAGVSEKEIKNKDKVSKKQIARIVGSLLAQKALKKKINEVVFDRGGYKYHGRVRELAEGAREGGLKF